MKRRATTDDKSGKTQRRKAANPKRKPACAAVSRSRTSDVDLQTQLDLRTRELGESREQLKATNDVLQAISTSGGDLNRVFQTVLSNATRLCKAKFGVLHLCEGENFRTVALHNAPKDYAAAKKRDPMIRGVEKGNALDMVRETLAPVQVADVLTERAYTSTSAQARTSFVQTSGVRSLLAVPMLAGGSLIGVIIIYRQEVRPFTDKQSELVQNFAAQAVIAIENTRLLNELRQRTDDLSEALEQQTATSQVLGVISSSSGELEPVFQTMLTNATHLCEANFGVLFQYEEGVFRAVALHGAAPPSFLETRRRNAVMQPIPGTALGRLVAAKQTVQIADARAEPAYSTSASHAEGVQTGDIRTVLSVPMLKEGELVGAFNLCRHEVRAFSEKQIELVTNFAAQAVIAIENTRLLNELRESLSQQTATADVLKVISRSAFDLKTVLEALVQSAARLCEADMVSVTRPRDGGNAHYHVASFGFSSEWFEAMQTHPLFPERGTLVGRTLLERQTVHIADVLADPEYTSARAQQLGGFRAVLGVPLLREGVAVGVFMIARKMPQPFTPKQIELVTTFADQALIAIENVRLFDEVQERTADLSEALEQQTATSEVLKVISSSPGELEPVFSSMLSNAVRICEAGFGAMWLYDGKAFRAGALHRVPDAFVEFWKDASRQPTADSALGRVARTKQAVQIVDLKAEPAYAKRDPMVVAGVDLARIRSFVVVPMIKENELVGAIGIYQQEVRPFTDKQVELVSNFAAQAVIAVENTRLLSELRESLSQQTATADVLKVISRSTFDLQTVLDTLVQSAAKLCQADMASINREAGDGYRQVASFGYPPEFTEFMKKNLIPAGRGSVVGRTISEGRVVQIQDVLADPDFKFGAAARVGGIRTILGVPLLREGTPIGVIALQRITVRTFTEKQIALVESFADQAVIAIENARLLNELRESLQQQTATAEVLKVISRSTFDLMKVLDTLLRSAGRLCDADQGTITQKKGDLFYRSVAFGFPPEFLNYVKDMPVEPSRETGTGRALVEGKVVHIPDVNTDPDYTWSQAQKLGGFRTMLCVPMLREGQPSGVLTLTRTDVRPFTEKQIELVATFADQAAIAIENVRLFESVEARTRELAQSLEDLQAAQDRLVQTQKLASLGQLTAGIAHEIKNPLNFVNNFSAVSVELIDELRQALSGARLDSKLRTEISEIADMLQGNLDKVVQHGKRADSIVKNMLLHSRQGSAEHRPVDINALVEESLNLAYHGARAEKQDFNITLERSFDPHAGEIDVFPQEITRVLLNLISNGFYAATKRKGEMDHDDGYEPTLAAATKSLGDRVEIRIRDNGTGIPPDVKDRMFNPFFTTKPAGEGTGLGLSISHDIIVKQHGGSIEVDTQPGEFTEIRIILPRTAASVAKSGAQADAHA